jgi:formate dehydrogenase iron-sulfur subunit
MTASDRVHSPPRVGLSVLIGLAILGVGLIGYRFYYGLGAVTNLSDGYPWGFWIAIDILVGIALAAGGFVIAGVVHLFGGRRFHPIARPAILTALLGYLLFVTALLVDLGRPWNIWWALFSWNHSSPMFEVAWCVMFYTVVLILELLPAVLERFAPPITLRAWRTLTPFVVMALLTLFAYAMTASLAWAATTFAVLVGWEVLMRSGVMPRDKQMPLLLILAGVVLSTLHQSSLGTLFLIVNRLDPIWYTPVLPHLFFLSAVMVAPAVVTIESTLSSRVLRREPEVLLLESLGASMPYFISAYLLLRVSDLVMRGIVWDTLATSFQAVWWWLEIGLLALAMALFAIPDRTARRRALAPAALATVAAVVVHRAGVAIVGISVPGWPAYIPAWSEVLITAGIVSVGLLGYRAAVEYLPIYGEAAADRRRFVDALRRGQPSPWPPRVRQAYGGR